MAAGGLLERWPACRMLGWVRWWRGWVAVLGGLHGGLEPRGDACPFVPPGGRFGEVQEDAPAGAFEVASELDEALAQRRDLCPRQVGAGGCESELLVEHERGGVQQESGLTSDA